MKALQGEFVAKQSCKAISNTSTNRHLVSLVGKAPAYRAGGLGSIPGRTNTQDLKIIEEKVLPLL